jgi:hypothetical protein
MDDATYAGFTELLEGPFEASSMFSLADDVDHACFWKKDSFIPGQKK